MVMPWSQSSVKCQSSVKQKNPEYRTGRVEIAVEQCAEPLPRWFGATFLGMISLILGSQNSCPDSFFLQNTRACFSMGLPVTVTVFDSDGPGRVKC